MFYFFHSIICCYTYSPRANPLVRSLGQVNLDSDKWKLLKNLFEYFFFFFSKFGFRASRWNKLRQRLFLMYWYIAWSLIHLFRTSEKKILLFHKKKFQKAVIWFKNEMLTKLATSPFHSKITLNKFNYCYYESWNLD